MRPASPFRNAVFCPPSCPPWTREDTSQYLAFKQVRYDDKIPQTECQPAHCPTREESCTHISSTRSTSIPQGINFYGLPRALRDFYHCREPYKEREPRSPTNQALLRIVKAQEEAPWLWGATQLAAWGVDLAFKGPGRLFYQQQGTTDENWQAAPGAPCSPEVSHPACSGPRMLLQC